VRSGNLPGDTTRSGLRASRIAVGASNGLRKPRWWRELLLVAALYTVYDLIRASLSVTAIRAERDGFAVLRWERLLHLEPEHVVNRLVTQTPAIAIPACFFYASAYIVVTPVVLIWLYQRHNDDYRATRTVLAIVTSTALVGFWLYPTAPPRLLSGAGFTDTLADYSSWGWWRAADNLPAGMASIGNEFAAMPSLHVAWSLWCAAVVIRHTRRRSLMVLAVAYPAVTVLVVIGTANHYLLDAVAGAALWLGVTVVASAYRLGSSPDSDGRAIVST
jgi:hypothetical protein